MNNASGLNPMYWEYHVTWKPKTEPVNFYTSQNNGDNRHETKKNKPGV